jgi:hypothetical protein
MEQINVFMKGITSDLDNSYVQRDGWVFPTRNIQIMNRDGRGFVVCALKGNEVLFEVDEDFIVIAAAENRGILYIVSVNELTFETALGSYPSPDRGHFVNRYNHFQNFNGGSFITTKFGFNRKSNVKLLVEDAYDESTDLYLCDGLHVDKIVNSGFKIDAQPNDFVYDESNFDNILNHIPFSLKPITPFLTEVSFGGNLKPGMYNIYFRYSTLNFDKTEYNSVLYPVQVGEGFSASTTRGVQDKDADGNQLYINKKIEIELANVDTAFTYLEVGIVRQYSGEDDNIINEVYEIATRYFLATLNKKLVIYGTEPQTILTIDNLLAKYAKERISKDHVFFNGRIWKSNLKRLGYDKELLSQLPLLVDAFTYDFEIGDKSYTQIQNGEIGQYGYQDPVVVSTTLSYFEGEIYPFGLIFLLDDGTITESFPMRNFDFITGFKKVYGNDFPAAGLIRFPFAGYNKGVRVAFDFSDMMDLINSDPNLSSRIKGVYVSQGEKIENLVYNGVIMPTVCGASMWHGFDANPENFEMSFDPFYFGGDGLTGAYSFPFPYAPRSTDLGIGVGQNFTVSVPVGLYDASENGHYYYYYNGVPITDPKKLAFISTESILSNKSRVYSGKRYILEVFSNSIKDYTVFEKESDQIQGERIEYTQPEYVHDIEYADTLVSFLDDKKQEVTAFDIEKGQHKGEGGFTSFMNDGTSSESAGFISDAVTDNYIGYNRGFITPRYIGLTFDTVEENYHFKRAGEYKMASLYLQKNNTSFMDEQIRSFNPAYKEYHIVSRAYTVGELSRMTRPLSITKGDNFKMRSFIRLIRYYGLDFNPDDNHVDNPGFNVSQKSFYQFGLMLGMITSSRVNQAMRSFLQAKDEEDDLLYSFYPANKTLTETPHDWIVKSDYMSSMNESYAVNHGYDKASPDIVYMGYEKDLPTDVENYPTKIIFSSKSIPDSYKNNYRDIPTANAQKFQTKFGEILRLQEGFGILMSIRPKAVMQHYIGQKELQSTGAEIITGSTDVYLSDEESPVGYYGIQQWTAIAATKSYLYGFDSDSAVAWRISFDRNAYGKRVPNQELLSKQFFNDNAFKSIISMMGTIESYPFKGTGITIGVDENNSKIIFSFFKLDDGYRVNESLIFDESLQIFTSPTDEISPLYVTLGKEMISIPPIWYPLRNKVFKSNVKDSTQFYGEEFNNQISFIVNGSSDDPKTNASTFTKIFDALDIKSPEKDLISVAYETETQSGTWYFSNDSASFWEDAEYKEDKWLVPLVMSSKGDGEYLPDSNLRGQWMKVTITFKQDVSFFIRSVITNFEISFI